MDAITIAEAADTTGFTPSTLRFYETAGLINPERSAAGYRVYNEADLAALHFIGRAKRLGLTIEEIAELVPMLNAEQCAPIQGQLKAFVTDKITETQQRTTELVGFLGQLQQMAAWLNSPAPDGACDDSCGCTTDPSIDSSVAAREGWVGATIVPAAQVSSAVPIVCTLGPDDIDERIAAWQKVTANAVARETIDGGVRVRLPRTTDLAALAQLMADEQTCCSFFTFALTVNADAVYLDALAPEEATPLVHAIVGSPA